MPAPEPSTPRPADGSDAQRVTEPRTDPLTVEPRGLREHAGAVRQDLTQRARRRLEIVRPTTVRQLPPRTPVTLTVVAFATLLVVAVAARGAATAVTVASVALASGVIALGWTRLVGLPSRRGTLVTVGISAALLLASVALPDDGGSLRWVPAALAVGVVVSFLHQLVRRDGRPRVVVSLSGTLLALGILAAGVTWVALPSMQGGRDAAVAAWAALACAAGAEWLCHRARWFTALAPSALLAGAVAGGVVGALVDASLPWCALLGAACAAASLALRVVLAPLPALVSLRAQAVSGVASVLVVGPLVETAARHLLAP